MSLHRLLGFHAAVPDRDALSAFYRELGLAGDPVGGFTGSDGGAAVTLEAGRFRRLHAVTAGCADAADLEVIARRLAEGGATAVRHDDAVSVVDLATQVRFEVKVSEPMAPQEPPSPLALNAPGRVVRANVRSPMVFAEPRPPRRLGHLVIGSPDPQATASLLTEGLGFKESDSIAGVIWFLRCSPDHHNIALVESPVPLLQHYSWECDDIDHVGHAATALLRTDPERHVWGIGRHFAGSNFYWYLRDPSGSFLELYSDLDQILDDSAWENQGRTAFTMDHVANAWGANLPLEFIVPTDLSELQKAWGAER